MTERTLIKVGLDIQALLRQRFEEFYEAGGVPGSDGHRDLQAGAAETLRNCSVCTEDERHAVIDHFNVRAREAVNARRLARAGLDRFKTPAIKNMPTREALQKSLVDLLGAVPPVNPATVDAVCQFTRNKMWRLDYVPSKFFLPGCPEGELAKMYRELALFGYIALDADGNPCCLTGKDPKIPREPMTELQADVAHLLKTLDSDGYVMVEQVNKVVAHLVRLAPLERRVAWMLDQKFDDLCWLDVYRELGKILGREFHPEQMPREQFLANCARYHDSLARDCKYEPAFPPNKDG